MKTTEWTSCNTLPICPSPPENQLLEDTVGRQLVFNSENFTKKTSAGETQFVTRVMYKNYGQICVFVAIKHNNSDVASLLGHGMGTCEKKPESGKETDKYQHSNNFNL